MRLLRATVRNYRAHRELAVEFDRAVTLLVGPNEVGKSTFLEAVHRGLLLFGRLVRNRVLEVFLRVREFQDHPLDRGEIETGEHGLHHVLAELGEPVHQRPRLGREIEPLRTPIVGVCASLDQAVGTETIHQPGQRDRLQVEHLGEFRLLQALVRLQPGQHRPLGACHTELACPMVRVGAEQAAYITDQKSKFAARIARTHRARSLG